MDKDLKNLSAWLDWAKTVHHKPLDLGLERIRRVFQRGPKQKIAKHVITVAGTNGKGSTVCALESILVQAGYRVGSSISPHLFSVQERIKMNGEPLSEDRWCASFAVIEKRRGDIP